MINQYRSLLSGMLLLSFATTTSAVPIYNKYEFDAIHHEVQVSTRTEGPPYRIVTSYRIERPHTLILQNQFQLLEKVIGDKNGLTYLTHRQIYEKPFASKFTLNDISFSINDKSIVDLHQTKAIISFNRLDAGQLTPVSIVVRNQNEDKDFKIDINHLIFEESKDNYIRLNDYLAEYNAQIFPDAQSSYEPHSILAKDRMVHEFGPKSFIHVMHPRSEQIPFYYLLIVSQDSSLRELPSVRMIVIQFNQDFLDLMIEAIQTKKG